MKGWKNESIENERDTRCPLSDSIITEERGKIDFVSENKENENVEKASGIVP